MSVEDNKAVAAAFIERVGDRGDLDAVGEFYAAGYTEHDFFHPASLPASRG